MTNIQLFLIFICCGLAQKPCTSYLNDESGCIATQNYSCAWNELLSSCQSSTSEFIGCNISLNMQSCTNQIAYPNDNWAYCRFSGYCRQVTANLTTCDKNLSVAACLAATQAKCAWNIDANDCETISDQTAISLQASETYTDDLKYSSVLICQGITSFPAVHSYDAQDPLYNFYNTYSSTNRILALLYKEQMDTPGCLVPDGNLLNKLNCTATGLNRLACMLITTPGQLCVFKDGKCQNSTDPSQIQCADPINQQTCLSVTNYKFPCYWHENKCKQLVMTAAIACNTYKIGVQTIQVSPSFCSANVSVESDGSGTECFYNAKKFRCHSMCRAKSTKIDSKACRQSSFGCIFGNNTCTFKNFSSQCGILGQNKNACMNAGENCQFLDGYCTKIGDVTSVNCKDNLNRKACISVTKKGQQCRFVKNQCVFYKATFYDSCEDLTDVNLNVCQRLNDSTCYWVNGNCALSVNQPCTANGLNRTGCLSTRNTISPCQWVAESGTCRNIDVVVNVTPCNLQLVNDLACRSIQTRNGNEDVKCKYNSDSFSCEIVTDLASINCNSLGINRAACVLMTDPLMACRWVQGSCIQVSQSLANIRCSSLMSVTQRTCTMVTAENEPCTYTNDGNRCTASVEKAFPNCTYPGLNAYGCAFLDNGKSCYFDDSSRSCTEITVDNQAVYNTLECSKGFTNKKACLLLTTPGERCQWDDYKKQCISYPFPTYEYCDTLTNAGLNLCIGFENDVSAYIDEFSYCTPDTDPTKCILYTDTTTLTNCGGPSLKINLHACVALSNSVEPCYFNLMNFQCTKALEANLNEVLSTILCKQAGEFLCSKIFTPDQACSWNVAQKKCYYSDQCTTMSSEADCMAVQQACIFTQDTTKCSLILTSAASTYKCSDTNIKFNQKSCLTIQGEACMWDGTTCSQVTPVDTNTCGAYDGDANKYNPVSCGLIKKTGEKCMHNKANQKCKTEVATIQCEVGQNEENCLQENGCQFTEGICSKLPFDCDTAKKLDDCRTKLNPCMWVISENKCKPSPEKSTCDDYNTDGVTYNETTCNNISASDALHICSSIQSTSGNYICQEIVNVKCSNATDIDGCRLIKNTCEFTTVCKNSNKIAKKCPDYFTLYSCLSDKNLYCQWSESEYCIDWDQESGSCGTVDNPDVESIVSTQVCYAFGCYFDISVLKCMEDTEIALTCEAAKSPNGCEIVPLNCYWDSDSKCKLLTDLNQAKSFSFNQVYYSNKIICLMPQNEGVLTQYTDTCQSPDVNEVLCSANINVRACEAIATDGQLCIYTNDKCSYTQISTDLCSNTINIHSCVAITTEGQYCVWLGQKCAFLTDDGFTINKYDTVNANTCKKTYTINGMITSTLLQIGVKFSLSQMGCIYSDPLIDKCNTPGLNYFGCLKTQVDTCTWSANKCIPFTDPGTYTHCADYRQVSARVCESIPKLLCYYSNYSCADATTKLTCTQSLSQQACIVQVNATCMWTNNKCQPQPILNGVTTCGSGIIKVAEYSSVLSCAMISAQGQTCRHEGNGCTTNFDPLIHGCSTPGLNLDGCVLVTIEKCIFQNNKCQVYEGNETLCRNLENVNAIVCASLDIENQPCKFSKVKNGCLESVGNDLCTTSGLNKAGCKQITSCNWNPDDSECYCVATTYTGKFCSNLTQNQCSYESKCMYDLTENKCRIIRCEDQSAINCQNRIINKRQCYIQTASNLIESCVSAQSCNDVKNVPDCSQIFIQGQQCVVHSGTQCAAQTCETIYNETQCSGKCIWNGFSCSTKKCNYITVQELCTGSYNNESCTWTQGFCVGFSSCQQYNTLTEDQTMNQSLCEKAIILNYQCKWQQDAPYSQTYECSSNPCKPLGSSKINCEGAEVQDQVCVLTSDYNCKSCNRITNDCQCTQYTGNCLWSNGTCRSVTCSSLSQANCQVFTEKCMWYEKDKSCLVICGKLKENNCKEMQLLSLCYWDTSLLRCNTGVPQVTQVDTVTSQLLPEGQVMLGYMIQALILVHIQN